MSYLKNRYLMSVIECKTPEKVWSCNIVDYSALKIFCCLCYAQVNNGKFNRRVRKCMFLGYAQDDRSYKLWCLELNSPIFGGEVTFDESLVLLDRSVTNGVHTDLDSV